MTHVDELVAYPFKSLDGVVVGRAALGPGGALRGDRSYALVEAGVDPHEASVGGGGGYVNGKSERRIHELAASYELVDEPGDATPTAVTLERPENEETGAPAGRRQFALPEEGDDLADWVGEFLGYPVEVVREEAGGFPDDREATGPTVVSRGTLEETASWFDDVADATEMRRRLRANVVLAAEEPFFEDRLFADRASRVRFTLGEATLLGVSPCQRCVVPSRNPDTGAEHPDFRETFLRKRRETMPEWSGGDWFDHDFRLMVNTVVPEESWGRTVAAGDAVTVDETVPAPDAGDGATAD